MTIQQTELQKIGVAFNDILVAKAIVARQLAMSDKKMDMEVVHMARKMIEESELKLKSFGIPTAANGLPFSYPDPDSEPYPCVDPAVVPAVVSKSSKKGA
jgi:hypothetical protein